MKNKLIVNKKILFLALILGLVTIGIGFYSKYIVKNELMSTVYILAGIFFIIISVFSYIYNYKKTSQKEIIIVEKALKKAVISIFVFSYAFALIIGFYKIYISVFIFSQYLVFYVFYYIFVKFSKKSD